MDERRRSGGRLAVLVVGEVAAVVALYRLGAVRGFAIPRHDLAQWLRTTPSEDVLLAGIRLGALVAAWWLLVSTVLYVAARRARLHRAVGALEWATLPCVRRWADAIAAASIVVASAVGAARPAGADPPPTTSPSPPPVVVEVDHRGRPAPTTQAATGVRTGRAADASPPSAPLPSAPLPTRARPLPAPPVPPAATTHTVVAGDNLWSIAADHLAVTRARPPSALTAGGIAPYWSRVVEMNRPHLRSGDPNLIVPGEIVELPPL